MNRKLLISCDRFSRFFSSKSKKREIEKYIQRQRSDEFCIKAREHSYRARSAFKLLEINEKFRIIRPGAVIIDVGAAPGSWCQVCADVVHSLNDKNGYVLGIDLQPMAPIKGVDLLEMRDITVRKTHSEIKERLKGRLVDAVISDMAPNPTGFNKVDHVRIFSLCEHLLYLCVGDLPVIPLADGGSFVCKIWDGKERKVLFDKFKMFFKSVRIFKPVSSRDSSSEIYIVALQRK